MVAMTSYAPAEAAKRTGLSLDTLRYYERLGLTGPIRRTTGGKRVYSEHDIAWFNLLTCLRRAGLGIADLQRFIGRLRGVSNGNHQSPNGSSDDSAEGADLTAQMEQMQTALRVLDGKIAHYRRLARSG